MAAHAFCGLEISVRRRAAPRQVQRGVDLGGQEFVAVGAIGFGAISKALGGLELGMPNATLLLMAADAARWRRRADCVAFELVALGAAQLVLNDVYLVTNCPACALPCALYLQRGSRRARIQARHEGGQRDRKHSRERKAMRRRHSPGRSIAALDRKTRVEATR